ncbi:hypothetical protein F2Q68_00030697 [Brassica cretica]|uniref:Uncharacterized protein n=2 Tax=Brassica cretica TaxID=69181 RepID=A0ABQ7BJ44_BRACR|nr:hypothetical protein F2Q68_00030697 [Brassica cretica]KAF3532249.1 hypothetical protein DY000_02039253 [Brassica cretica]
MINSFKVFELDKLSGQKCFQYGNDINSDLVLSFDKFKKHNKCFDHLEMSFELVLQQPDFCFRKPCDPFVCFEDNGFDLSFSSHELITGGLFASTYALDELMTCDEFNHLEPVQPSSLVSFSHELKENPEEEDQMSSPPEKLLEQLDSTEPKVILQPIPCQSQKHYNATLISYATLGELVELYQTDYLGELNQSDTYLAELDELNTQVSWTDTHLEELNELVRSSELVRPLEKIPSVNSISDEPSQSLQGSKSYPWPRPIRIAKENMLDE